MEKEKQKLFLEDGSILPWERHPEEGQRNLSLRYNGSTTLIKQIGFDTIDKAIGSYRIVGSSAKYLADIIHLDKDHTLTDGPVSGEKKRKILFSGSLSIYNIRQIPGTKIFGPDFERHGRIWVARDPQEQFSNSEGLNNLIFENDIKVFDRIEAILLGYQTQEDNREDARCKLEYENRAKARIQGPSGWPPVHRYGSL